MSQRCVGACALALTLAASLPAAAQYGYNQASIEAVCHGTTVVAQGFVWNYVGFDPAWAGWVVARAEVGACTDWVAVSPVQAFPGDDSVATTTVSDVTGGDRTTVYAVLIVDAGGDLVEPALPYFGPPNVYFAYATCGQAPVARGTLVDLGGAIGVMVCDGDCWAPVATIAPGGLPAEYAAYVGTDQVLDLYGTVHCDDTTTCDLTVTFAVALPSCAGSVAAQARTWGSVKSLYGRR